MGFLESMGNMFGNNKNKKPDIVNSYEDVDPTIELEKIKRRISEINQVLQENWSDDLRNEIQILQTKKTNLEETISKQNQGLLN